MLQVCRKNQFNLHDIQINKRTKQTGKLDRITLDNTKNKSKERRNSKKEKGSYFILYLQIIFMSKIILRLISYGWDDKFYEKYMYNLIQTHIIYIYIYSNIARATKVALANFRIYKSEECLPKWARNNSSHTEEYFHPRRFLLLQHKSAWRNVQIRYC